MAGMAGILSTVSWEGRGSVDYLKVISLNFSEGTEKNHKEPQLEYLASVLRIKPRTYGIQSRNDHLSILAIKDEEKKIIKERGKIKTKRWHTG
jgi:hypothetical protein